MLSGFEKWWSEQGRYLDPDTEDVPWYDKREGLAHLAFDEGVKIGMAQAGNYVADDSVNPTKFTFANGRCVKSVNGRLVLVQPDQSKEPSCTDAPSSLASP